MKYVCGRLFCLMFTYISFSSSAPIPEQQCETEVDDAGNTNNLSDPLTSNDTCVLCFEKFDAQSGRVTVLSMQESMKTIFGSHNLSPVEPNACVCENCNQECLKAAEKQMAVNEEISKIKCILSSLYKESEEEEVDDANNEIQQNEDMVTSPDVGELTESNCILGRECDDKVLFHILTYSIFRLNFYFTQAVMGHNAIWSLLYSHMFNTHFI